jgi:hypothetical protein
LKRRKGGRERQRQKEEAARVKEHARHGLAVAKAQAALEKAEREHERRAAIVDAERASLEERSHRENQRWETERKKLEGVLRRVREQG